MDKRDLDNYINNLSMDEADKLNRISLIIAAQTHIEYEEVDQSYNCFDAMYGDSYIMRCVKAAIEITKLYN